jgi:hypothetical protein
MITLVLPPIFLEKPGFCYPKKCDRPPSLAKETGFLRQFFHQDRDCIKKPGFCHRKKAIAFSEKPGFYDNFGIGTEIYLETRFLSPQEARSLSPRNRVSMITLVLPPIFLEKPGFCLRKKSDRLFRETGFL